MTETKKNLKAICAFYKIGQRKRGYQKRVKDLLLVVGLCLVKNPLTKPNQELMTISHLYTFVQINHLLH
jgi:hypothetical protein